MAIKFIESVNMNNALYVNGVNERVGIGIENPQAQLHIDDSSNDTSGLRFTTVGTGTSDEVNIHFQGTAGSAPFYISRENTGGAEIQLVRNGDILFNATGKGNVGINTKNPEQILHVEGHVLVSGSSTSDTMTLRSTATSSTASAPDLKLRRNRSATSGATHGVVEFQGYAYNSSTLKSFGGIYSRIYSGSDNWSLITLSTNRSSTYDHVANFGLTSSNVGGVILNPPAQDTPPSQALDVRGNGVLSGHLEMSTGVATSYFAVNTSNYNASYNLYVNGTGYFNNTTTVNGTFNQTGGNDSNFSGDVNVVGTSNVNIGTSTPTSGYQLKIEDGQTAGFVLSDTGQTGDYQFAANSDLCYWRYNGDNSKGIFLKNSGRVGIGTTSPNQELHVNGDLLVSNHIYLNSGTSNSIVGVGGGIEFYSDSQKRMDITFGGDVQIFEDLRIGGSSGPTLSKNANNALQIGNGSASIAHILTSGGSTALSQLLVGNTGGSNPTPAPAIFEAINLAGNNQVANLVQQEDSNSSTTEECLRLKHDGVNDGNFGLMVTFRDLNSVIKGKISSTSTSTTYSTSSDQRLKEDEKDFDGLDLVSQMKPYDFKWKEDGSRDYGMFAQELVNVVPNAVDVPTKKDGVTVDEDEHYFADYSKLVPVLVKAIQELEQKVKDLESKS